MDKRYIISFAAIFVLVILFIISIAFSPKEAEVIEGEKTCEEKCSGVESCLLECANIRANIATLNNDASESERINNLEKRDECLRNVNLKTALTNEDETNCTDENCMNSVRLSKALNSKDSSLCEQITIDAMKADCLELVR